MNIEITVKAPEIVSALCALASGLTNSGFHELAEAIRGRQSNPVLDVGGPTMGLPEVPAAPLPQPAQQAPVIPFVPTQQYLAQQQFAHQPVQTPAMPPPAPAPAVPTAAQTYTLDQMAVAATSIMDAGKRGELVALLGQFGVPSLTALPKEQYGAFATQLRALGAKI